MGIILAEDAAVDTTIVDELATTVSGLAEGSGTKRRETEVALAVLMTAAVPLQSPQKRRQTSATTPIVPPPAPICSPGGTLWSPPRPTHIS
jgi:hypothetical protein